MYPLLKNHKSSCMVDRKDEDPINFFFLKFNVLDRKYSIKAQGSIPCSNLCFKGVNY